MKKVLAVLLLAVISVAAATAQEMKKSDDSMMMKKNDSTAASKMATESPFGSLTGLGKQVVGFTSEKDAQTLAKTQTVVYFFAASWCPECKATFKDISANFSQIPKNLTIVIVNYDKAPDLKTKYGVTKQHTFVTIDATGAKKKIWNGSPTVKDILSKAGIKTL